MADQWVVSTAVTRADEWVIVRAEPKAVWRADRWAGE